MLFSILLHIIINKAFEAFIQCNKIGSDKNVWQNINAIMDQDTRI